MRFSKTLFLVSSVALPTITLGQVTQPAEPAKAATGSSSNVPLAEVVVTAQRRSESLQRVPLAVTALSADALEARGITNLNNLSTSVAPGVTITEFAGTPSTLAMNIRGAYTSDPGIGLAEQGVAIYEDGVPLGRAVGTGIELGDIQRIELLRGPQGTLFGRNAEGGAVQFITKRPTGVLGGRVEQTFGNFGQIRTMGVLELPEFGNVAVKLSGLLDRHDGYTDNLKLRPGVDFATPGFQIPTASFKQEHGNSYEDLGMKDQRGFRVAALWEPSVDLTAYYTFDFSDLDYTVSYNSRTGGRVPSSFAWCLNPTYAATCATPQSIAANVYTGTPSQQPVTPNVSDVPLFTPASANHIRGHGLTFEYLASDSITLKSITGYRTVKEEGMTNLGTAQVFVQTLPTSAFAANVGQLAGFSGAMAPARIDQDQFSQELQMLGSFDHLTVTSGLFYYYERIFDVRSSPFALGYQVVDATNLRPIALDPFDFGGTLADGLPASYQKYRGTAHSYAAYTQATYTPSSVLDGNLSVTVGLRYTKDKKEFNRLRAAAGSSGANSSTFDADRFDPAFTVAYQLTPDVNVYARYARAYRAGGTGIRNKLALTTYDPEVNTSYEAGLKTELLDNRVRFNLAAFHSVIKDAQVSFQNSNLDPSSTDTVNVSGGDIKIDGIELEAQAQIASDLSLSVGYSYMDGSVSGSVSGPVLSGVGTTTLVTVPLRYNPYLPEHQANVAADYSLPLDRSQFFAHLEYSYMSDQRNSPFDVTLQQEAFSSLSQVNARLGLRNIDIGVASMAVELYGRNIFDEDDYSYCYGIGASDFTVAATPGGSCYAHAPRTYGVTAKLSF